MSIPRRGHETDAGIDLTAMAVEQKRPDIFFFDSGISIHVSNGFFVEIFPRSSIIKTDFILANSVGIIDPDYRGRIFMPFRYLGSGDGMQAAKDLLHQRIAQMLKDNPTLNGLELEMHANHLRALEKQVYRDLEKEGDINYESMESLVRDVVDPDKK